MPATARILLTIALLLVHPACAHTALPDGDARTSSEQLQEVVDEYLDDKPNILGTIVRVDFEREIVADDRACIELGGRRVCQVVAVDVEAKVQARLAEAPRHDGVARVDARAEVLQQRRHAGAVDAHSADLLQASVVCCRGG